MRVTDFRMLEVAMSKVMQSRERAQSAADVASGGQKVSLPSQDLAAWSDGVRARTRKTMSEARGQAITRARDRLVQLDSAFADLQNILGRTTELGVQLTNAPISGGDRISAATELRSLQASALALVNARGPDGEFLLAGSRGTQQPFTSPSTYSGDALTRTIETGEGAQLVVSLPGTVLTAVGGVDVLGVLETMSLALEQNNVPNLRAALDTLNSGVDQLAQAHAQVGSRMRALDEADGYRQQFELNLAALEQRSMEGDQVAAVSEMMQAKVALENSQAMATAMNKLVQAGG